MYYVIHVSRRRLHYFSTSDNSLVKESKAIKLLADFEHRFPAHEGFEVSMVRWDGTRIELQKTGGQRA